MWKKIRPKVVFRNFCPNATDKETAGKVFFVSFFFLSLFLTSSVFAALTLQRSNREVERGDLLYRNEREPCERKKENQKGERKEGEKRKETTIKITVLFETAHSNV